MKSDKDVTKNKKGDVFFWDTVYINETLKIGYSKTLAVYLSKHSETVPNNYT